MTRKQLNQLLLLATNEYENHFSEWFCGEQTPEVLQKLSRAQNELEMVREQIRELNRPQGQEANDVG
ncbi:MAG: hypothetical protein CV087_07500 [Candidatus Brocadia sp. WS118]|nr:MAG: hypothetical protein CV087_07500 [Candidatus Brocadia sp. WS118]